MSTFSDLFSGGVLPTETHHILRSVTWTAPANGYVRVVAASGGGGGVSSEGGGGGGASELRGWQWKAITAGQQITFTIGAGGALGRHPDDQQLVGAKAGHPLGPAVDRLAGIVGAKERRHRSLRLVGVDAVDLVGGSVSQMNLVSGHESTVRPSPCAEEEDKAVSFGAVLWR